MASRNDPAVELDLDASEPDAGADHIKQTINVYSLSEYFSDNQFARRSDPGVPRKKLGSESNTEDMAAVVKKFAKAPGAYLAELRLDGQVVETKVFIVKPKVGTMEAGAPASDAAPTATPAESPAHVVVEATNMVRAMKDFSKEIAPPAPAPLTKEDVALMIEQAVSKVAAQVAAQMRAAQPESGEMSFKEIYQLLREERKEAREELRALLSQQNPNATTPLQEFVNTYRAIKDISDEVNPAESGEGRGFLDQAAGLIDSIGRNAERLEPVAANVINRVISTQAAEQQAQAQTAAQPVATAQPIVIHTAQPQAESDTAQESLVSEPVLDQPDTEGEEGEEPLTLDIVLRNLINDIRDGHSPKDAISDVVTLATEKPETRPLLFVVMNMTNEQLLQELHRRRGVDLSALNNVGRFLDGLRKGVKARINLAAPASVPNNGHAASTQIEGV